MKIIILEGIPTCGKSSVKRELEHLLQDKEYSFISMDEEQTMWPLREETDKEVCLHFLKDIIKETQAQGKDVAIFDRLYFSQVFRTKSTIEDFKALEDLIGSDGFTAFLAITEDLIPKRIANAMLHRPDAWTEHVKKKGTQEEIHAYYKSQQQTLMDLLKQSHIKHKIYNTDDLDFKNIAKEIVNDI